MDNSILGSFFRTLGLRHLVVVNSDHCVTGVITRKDLIESRLEQIWHQEVCVRVCCVVYISILDLYFTRFVSVQYIL